MPYGGRYLGQHWLRSWLVAWRHQAITSTNADLSSLRPNNHLMTISLEISQPSVTKISLKIIFLKCYWNLPGANELRYGAECDDDEDEDEGHGMFSASLALCDGIPPVAGQFPSQGDNNAENVSISWGNYGSGYSLEWHHNGAMASQISSLTIVYSRRRSKKISKLRVTGLCAVNSPLTGEFHAQRASNEENVSIWWRHQEYEIWNVFTTLCRIPIPCHDNFLVRIK